MLQFQLFLPALNAMISICCLFPMALLLIFLSPSFFPSPVILFCSIHSAATSAVYSTVYAVASVQC